MNYSHTADMNDYTTSSIRCNDDIIAEGHSDVKVVDPDALMILSDDVTGIVYTAPASPAPPPPPARILARFYRPSQTARRKSSAASSRRNSISSSTHSHHSNRSFQHHHRGGNGSKAGDHLAQHLLRRASIIENRRARLADRAAHAQQVRLRAALAKAVPQTRALSSEERALAAHQARERHLAQVAAACAEEVRRSKKVAEDMKERKAAEEKRYRLEMEERLAEADKRRAEYKKGSGAGMRRPRTASVVADEGEKKTAVATIAEEDEEEEEVKKEEIGGGVTGIGTVIPSAQDFLIKLHDREAATRIQKIWRRRRDRLAARDFLSFGLSMQKVHVSEFETISGLLSEERVIRATRKILQLLMRMTNESGIGEIDGGSTSVRAFLSVYLILGHPTAIFRHDGEQEALLMSRAKDLLTIFEAALSELAEISSLDSTRPTVTFDCASQSDIAAESFLAVYKQYMTAFTAWKAHDFSALVDTMVASFVELDAIWQTVKDKGGDEAAEEYREGIRSNQALILGKIKTLAGPEKANGLVLNAVRESRKGRKRSRREDGDRSVEGNVWPRAVLGADGDGDVMAVGKVENLHHEAASGNEMPGSNLTALPSTAAAKASASASASTVANSTTDHSQTLQLSRLFSPIPSNRVLAHEVALDKSYRITLSPCFANKKNNSNAASSSPSVFSDSSVYVEVCAAMRRGFESGQGNIWTVAMAENIRGKLLHLLSPGSSMHSLIAETLDSGHVHRQCSKGVFSYERFFSFMADILPRLCAPVRDAEVKMLVGRLRDCDDGVNGASSNSGGTDRLTDLMDKLLSLLNFINLLSLDYSNYMLQQAIPLLLKEAAGYEQRLFAQELENGVVTLERTRAWWKRAIERWRAEVADGCSGNNSSTGGAPPITTLSLSHQHTYARALFDTALGGGSGVAGGLAMPVPIPYEDLPETLTLDLDRLTLIRINVLRVVVAGAILLTAKNLLKRDVRVPWRAEASRLMELLRDGDGGGGGGGGGFTSAEGTAIEGPSMTSRILTVLESSHALPPITRTQLHGTISKFLAQAAGQFTNSAPESSAVVSKITDPVMKVLLQRVRMYISGRIGISNSTNNHGNGQTNTTRPITTTNIAPTIMTGLGTAISGGAATSPLSSSATSSGTGNTAMGDISPLISSGLFEFIPQLAELAESLKRIGEVDWEAHCRWYSEMDT